MMIIPTMMIRMTTGMISVITASSAFPMAPALHLKRLQERDDDDHHDDYEESDDFDDNHHEDEKDDDSHDNCHRSILCMTKACHDCHDNCHRSVLCITNSAESEIMMIIRTMMIRMTTVMISIITASSALLMVPNATVEMYRRKR